MRMTTAILWSVCAAGCLRDPDPGGQEGEEFRATDESMDAGNGGASEPGGALDTGYGDTESSLELRSWLGALSIERGSGADPSARDCVLRWDMEGTPSDLDCGDCSGVFDVIHQLDRDASTGVDVCGDLPEQFSRTYAVTLGAASSATVWVWDADAGFIPYASGAWTSDMLTWTVGLVEVPMEDASGERTYRTDFEQGVVSTD